MQILDGSGKGYRAYVDSEGRLNSISVVKTIESYISEKHGLAFTVSTLIKTLNSTNNHHILLFKNQSPQYDMRIWQGNFSWNGGSTNHNRVLKWGWWGGSSVPSANYEEIEPANLNLKSNNSSGVVAYKWDGNNDGMTLSSAGTLNSEELISQGTTITETKGIPVIGYNDVISLSVAGEEIGDVGITVRFYMSERIGV